MVRKKSINPNLRLQPYAEKMDYTETPCIREASMEIDDAVKFSEAEVENCTKNVDSIALVKEYYDTYGCLKKAENDLTQSFFDIEAKAKDCINKRSNIKKWELNFYKIVENKTEKARK